MKLHNPTDEQLDAAFATEVAGWISQPITENMGPLGDNEDFTWIHYFNARGQKMSGDVVQVNGQEHVLTRFTRSADAVLPWLEKLDDWNSEWYRGVHHIGTRLIDLPCPNIKAEDKSFPRAAVIALLRAYGVEVTFDSAPTP